MILRKTFKVFFPILSLLFITVYSQLSLAGGVVVVHPSNNSVLDLKSVQRIFLGKLNSFSTGEKATALDLPKNLEVNSQFSQQVLDKSLNQLKSYWAKQVFTGKGTPPKEVDSAAALIQSIKDNPNAIGYLDAADVTSDIKVVLKF